MSTISIIIPTLNEEKIIKTTLENLAQLTIPHEIIISDGGSKDRTAEISRSLGAEVFVHDNSYRQTIAEGRNVGGFAATGEFLVFMDADCSLSDPDAFFNRALAYFRDHPKLVAIAPSIKILPENATLADKLVTWCVNTSYRFITNIFRIGAAPGEFQMVKRDVFQKLGGYNKKLVTGEDVEFFGRLSRSGSVKFLSGLTVWHTGRRVHAVGWPKLLSQWFINTVGMLFRGKSFSDEWTPIR